MTKPDLEPDLEIDARGLRCPLPVIRMESALRKMAPGQKLKICADDPIAALDLPHFAQQAGHEIERMMVDMSRSDGNTCVFMVTRGEKP